MSAFAGIDGGGVVQGKIWAGDEAVDAWGGEERNQ